jgi:hypothetical protein
MRLITNDKLIARQSKIARYATFGALAILLGSLVTSFNTAYIVLAYGTLFVGMALAYVGSSLGYKWVKEPRADQALAKALKGFDNKHHLYNFLLPVAHVLVTPTGVLVFLVKQHDGKISLANGRWTRAWAWGRLFGGMGQGALGNPLAELDAEIEKLEKFLAEKLPNAPMIPVNGYVVFSDPRAELSLDDSAAPVVRVDDLKETLRKTKHGAMLAPKIVDDLVRAFDETADAKTAK